jgi:hypothetical protein
VAPDPQTALGPAVSALLTPDATAIAVYAPGWLAQVKLLPPAPHEPVTVEVIRFGDPLDAFGAFAALRSTAAEPALIPALSCWTGRQYCVWREEFLVRLLPANTGAGARVAAEAAAEAVLGLMPLPAQLPLMLRLMPEARQVPQSLRYYRENLLGRLPLGDALGADYLENGTQLQLALVRYASDEAAREAYDDVLALLATGAQATPLPLLGRQAHTIPSRQFGLTYLVREGRYLLVALGLHDRDTAEGLLRITATNIRIVR